MTLPTEVRFNPELIARYDRHGPRYTSYPTALQFGASFGEEDYKRAATASAARNGALSLYVHIPFCASPCFYCGCNKVITRDVAKSQRYLDFLQREIELQAPLFRTGRTVEQLHFGGGTPTFLTPSQLRALMNTLGNHFSLHSRNTREYSIEIDPRTLNPETLPELADLGINRVSLGVQDFDPEVQRAVNRVQSAEDTLRAIAQARRAGFESVSIDLIYGLPKQTLATFDKTLDQALRARPDRMAVYGYAHMPQLFKAQRRIVPSDLPDSAQRIDLLGLTIEKLTQAGYVYIGMDHFALPDDELVRASRHGTLHRNFQGYSTRAECDLVGLGVSSIGKIAETYSQNARTLSEYYALLDSGVLPIRRGIALTRDDEMRREIIQQIMCQNSIDYGAISARFGIDFEQVFARELEDLRPLADDGLVTIGDQQIEITPTGRLLLRNVAMIFDAYLAAAHSEQAFSKAI